MAGQAESPKRSRRSVRILDLPPNVRAFADHLAAALAASILREIRAGQLDTIGRKPGEGRGERTDDEGK